MLTKNSPVREIPFSFESKPKILFTKDENISDDCIKFNQTFISLQLNISIWKLSLWKMETISLGLKVRKYFMGKKNYEREKCLFKTYISVKKNVRNSSLRCDYIIRRRELKLLFENVISRVSAWEYI